MRTYSHGPASNHHDRQPAGCISVANELVGGCSNSFVIPAHMPQTAATCPFETLLG
jgi:hypothetical protein